MSEVIRSLKVAGVSAIATAGLMIASQEMSTEYHKDTLDCVERFDGDVEKCSPEQVGTDHSGLVGMLGYGAAVLTVVSGLRAYNASDDYKNERNERNEEDDSHDVPVGGDVI